MNLWKHSRTGQALGAALVLLAIAAAVALWSPCEATVQAASMSTVNTGDSIDSSRRNAIVQAIEKASPAVVTINVVEIKRERYLDPGFNDFMGMFGFGVPSGGAIRERRREVESLGSGFLFDDEGHILTNYHVLQGGDAISSVTLSDGRQLEVDYVGHDDRTDPAVLKAKGTGLPHIEPGSAKGLMMGEWVIAIGNPFGNMMRDPQPSVSVGVVSANHRRVRRDVGDGERLYQDMIQTDAAINPGNSGGPLVDGEGRVVGVNTMIFSSSGGYQGLGFAIPIERALRVADEIIKNGRRLDPWFGFRGEGIGGIDAYTRQQLGLRAEDGVLVTEIRRDSPAYKAGLTSGDVVTEINGESVSDPVDVDLINWALFIGDSVSLTYDRAGKENTVQFNVEELSDGSGPSRSPGR